MAYVGEWVVHEWRFTNTVGGMMGWSTDGRKCEKAWRVEGGVKLSIRRWARRPSSRAPTVARTPAAFPLSIARAPGGRPLRWSSLSRSSPYCDELYTPSNHDVPPTPLCSRPTTPIPTPTRGTRHNDTRTPHGNGLKTERPETPSPHTNNQRRNGLTDGLPSARTPPHTERGPPRTSCCREGPIYIV